MNQVYNGFFSVNDEYSQKNLFTVIYKFLIVLIFRKL